MKNAKRLATKNPQPAPAPQPTIVLAFVEGGVVQDIDASTPANCYVFDWDDFRDDPLEYWSSRDEELQRYISTAPIWKELWEGIERELEGARIAQQDGINRADRMAQAVQSMN